MAVKKKDEAAKADQTFALGQMLASKKFNSRKDLLKAVLSENKRYSISEAEKKIEEFMKGKVK